MSESLQGLPEYNPEVVNGFENLTETQYRDGCSLNVKARWELYKHATEPINIHAATLEGLKLNGNETVLDAGCGDAETLLKLRSQHEHRGKLIGLEIQEDLFMPAQAEIEESNIEPIDFIVGNVERLPLAENSMDVAMGLFLLYHTSNPKNALSEFKRVLKPEGKLAIATSGKGNKARHREFERDIAQFLDIEPPPIFSERFNTEIADETLSQWFDIEAPQYQSDEMHFDLDNYNDYIESLQTMKNAFHPIPPASAWNKALNEVVKPYIENEIQTNGYFTDRIERSFYICRNN